MNLRKRALVGSPSTEATDREIENRKLVREAAAESFVLLKNENNLLPLEKGTKLGLYGAGAVKTVKGGTGSGDVNERDSVSIYQGLSNAGFEITSKDWLSGYQKTYEKSREDWKQSIIDKSVKENMNVVMAYFATPYHLPAGDPIPDCAKEDGADTAIFVLSRIAGEGTDRRDEELDYYLSKDERAMLDQLSACYKHIILLLNAGGIVDLSFLDEYPKIESVVNVLQPGQEGGNAVADVLCGKKTPSGKLADSWAMDYSDYPSAETFSFKSGDVFHEEYKEGIYVGYRYFDTFDVPVRYGFGFGLSYTTFSIKTQKVTVSNLNSENPVLTAAVEVTNTGVTYSGKEVVQIFVSCPQGSRVKEYRRLAGFAKTKELAPGEKQSLSITFPLYQLTSYEEETASWVLDGGNYGIWVGNSLSDAKLCAVLSLDQSAVMVSGSNICKKQRELAEITPDQAKLLEKQKAWEAIAKEENLPNLQIKSDQIQTKTISYDADQEAFIGRAKEIVENMTTDQLLLLATGDIRMGQGSAIGNAGQSVPGAAAETTSAFAKPPFDLASIVLADGPAGLRLNKSYQVKNGKSKKMDFLESFEGGLLLEKKPEHDPDEETYWQFCTAMPVGALLAQSWDTDLVKKLGEMIGNEMKLFEVTLWLAPGMNIHRNPLCGRNFEYYSEDPLLSGMMASAMTLGVQKVPGCGTTIKHFACNNQEDNRMGSDSIVSERALREIYLKGFEIAIKNAQPMSIMTSYNMINGVHAANCYDICTKAARDEWGFKGTIMTDWTTTTGSTAGTCSASGCMKAGNDIVMPGDPADHENLRSALLDGSLSLDELKRCVYHTVNIILQSNQYEDAASYEAQFDQLDTYLTVK